MKRKFSLNTLLHNERVVFILSVVLAVVIWALVSFGPGNIQQRTITITQTLNLNGKDDLRVIGQDTFTVSVTVEGARAVIFNLNPSDINIRPAYSEILGAGVSEIKVEADKVKPGAYEINAISPATITINCDYWITKNVPLTTNALKNAVSVKDETVQQIGDIRFEAATMANNTISIEGPDSVVKRIVSVDAYIENTRVLETTTNLKAKLKAVDANGNAVEMTNCRFVGASAENTVDMTVPVWVKKPIPLTYTVLNKPAGISENNLVKLTPGTITLVGESAAVEAAALSIGDLNKLGNFDFDHLTPADAKQVLTLNVPANVHVLEGTSVTVELAIDKCKTRDFELTISGSSDVVMENLSTDKKPIINEQKLEGIVLCGPSYTTLKGITAKDLLITLVNTANNDGVGLEEYEVRITVPKHDSVWVYCPSDLRIYGDIK